ncbi:endonuclease V [Candidatus Woesearchaeota archaeon]|nr:endonuclease V [Candidatus Woesearchaeota archaeon]
MDVEKLKKEQIKLAKKVVLKDEFSELKLIGGCDQTFIGNNVISCVVVMDYDTLEVVETVHAVVKAVVPYVAGFLGYREGPAIVEAFNKLEKKPDILLCDFNGILHPRLFGAASQVGLMLDVPTIGVAKILSYGSIMGEKIVIGTKQVGVKVISREHSRPIYVSLGHKICLKSAVEIVKKCLKYPHKLPEPIHYAHKYAKKLQKEEEHKKKE